MKWARLRGEEIWLIESRRSACPGRSRVRERPLCCDEVADRSETYRFWKMWRRGCGLFWVINQLVSDSPLPLHADHRRISRSRSGERGRRRRWISCRGRSGR